MSDLKNNNPNGRRQFLKNASIAALSVGLFPKNALSREQESQSTMACDPTTKDYYGVGPFYTENPPVRETTQLAKASEKGERMIIRGRVMNLDCSEALANTVVDVWHANDAGEYDNDGYNLRGQFKTNSQGFYSFETIKPGKYLNGAKYRPSHIHFKITPENEDTLVTQLYFKGDSDIPGDAAASITSGSFDATHRIIELSKNTEGKLEGVWDIVVNGKGGNIGTNDLHLDKGVIYSVSPNPFSDRVEIKYGIFHQAQVGIIVYDIEGKEVARVADSTLSSEKYEAVWTPEPGLPDGTYFIALKVNDLQIQYMKIQRLRR